VRLLLIALGLLLPLRAQTLESVLSQMDEAAARFHSLRAHIRNVKYTAIVNDESIDEGTIWVKRIRPKVSHMLIEFTNPDHYFVSVSDRRAEVYRPKIATLEEYDVTKFQSLKDQLWLLSFGTAGRDLSAHYQLKAEGAEPVAGKPSAKLELIPKSAEMAQHIPRIEMWISTAGDGSAGQPVQQRFYDVTPGDYRLSTYTDIQFNISFPDSQLTIHAAPGTKRSEPLK
jgi:outer membrane lipoprotein-sorting protein